MEERLLSWRQELVMTVSVFFNHLPRYQSESNELTQWLQSAKERLEFWSQQSLTVPQELETVRDHLNSFLVSCSWTWDTYFSPITIKQLINQMVILLIIDGYVGKLFFKMLVCMHIKHFFAICNDCKSWGFWKQKLVLGLNTIFILT